MRVGFNSLFWVLTSGKRVQVWQCDLCGSIVVTEATTLHKQWHQGGGVRRLPVLGEVGEAA